MNLNAFAQSVAITVNKEESFEYVEKLKFDILGYRASIIAGMDDKSISDVYYQTFTNFSYDDFDTIYIPTPLTFKDGSTKLNAVIRYKNQFKRVNLISEEKGIYINYRRVSSKEPFLILSSNKLVPQNFKPQLLQDFSIKGIFANPLEVSTYANINKCKAESKCMVNDDLEIEDALYQKITFFLNKQLGVQDNINEIRNTQV